MAGGWNQATKTGNLEDLKSCSAEPGEEEIKEIVQKPKSFKRNQSVKKMRASKLVRDVGIQIIILDPWQFYKKEDDET